MAAVLRDNPSYHGYISLQVLGHMQQEDTGARAAVLGELLQPPQILHPCATPASPALPAPLTLPQPADGKSGGLGTPNLLLPSSWG